MGNLASRLFSGRKLLAICALIFTLVPVYGLAKEIKGVPVPVAASLQNQNQDAQLPDQPAATEIVSASNSPDATLDTQTSGQSQVSVDTFPAQLDALSKPFEFAQNTDKNEALVPFIVFFFLFGCPCLLIFGIIVLSASARARERERHQEYLLTVVDKLLAAGREVPVEAVRGDDPNTGADESLRKGVLNIGVGLGIVIFLSALVSPAIGAVGFIVIGLGISRVLVWKLLSKPKVERDLFFAEQNPQG